jgi:hypothetical protein
LNEIRSGINQEISGIDPNMYKQNITKGSSAGHDVNWGGSLVKVRVDCKCIFMDIRPGPLAV